MSFAVESVAPSKAGGLGLKPAFESQWVPEHVEETMSEEDILLRKTNTIVLTGSDVEAKREEIRLYFHRTFTVYEKLFEVLTDKAYYMRADRLRHPLIFYYGHTATFFINKMTIAGIIKERINPHYESLFAVGVDEMSWDDLLPESFDWPTVEEVKAYRDKAREVVDHAIRTTPLTLPIAWNDQFWCFLMGIEHERIHLETSSVLIRQLPLSVLKPHAFWNRCAKFSTEAPENELLPVIDNSQLVSLGKATDHPLYGWDNEYGTQTSMVAPFKASRYLVTNKEFLDFMEDGGYSKQEFWTEEGWRWANFRRAEKASHPLFWVPVLEEIPSMKQTISAAVKGAPSLRAPIGDSESDSSSSVGEDLPKFRMTYKFRTMLEEMEMPWDWPVETNYLEAKAFCNWKSAKTGKCIRLPMEDEYEVLRAEVDGDHPYWARAPGNLNLEYYCSSTPVTAFPPSRNGFYDVVGNVWQHTETPIDAFRGFRVHPWYDDFSVPTFDLQHNIIKGGSWISTGNEASNLSRYAFRRHFFQHAGFRYIETQRPVEVRNDIYERDSAVTLYAEMHYGLTEYLGVKNYPQTVASLCAEWAKGRPTRRALDMGCAVGRATFELARTYDYVVGLDFSARFIRMGVNLKEHGAIHYSVVEEGALTSDRTVTLDDLKLAAVKDKVEFFQADACNLDPRYNNYDLVLASNMIDRLYDPRLFLRTIRERINVGGLLVILDPYTWLEEHTPRECWLGGYMDRFGKEISTLEALKEVLAPYFRLVAGPTSIPVVLREHKRKFQYLNSEATCWERVQVE